MDEGKVGDVEQLSLEQKKKPGHNGSHVGVRMVGAVDHCDEEHEEGVRNVEEVRSGKMMLEISRDGRGGYEGMKGSGHEKMVMEV
ncbi:hypothetical protein U1Q18_029232 [Sarracenia purpurea var. burkii]